MEWQPIETAPKDADVSQTGLEVSARYPDWRKPIPSEFSGESSDYDLSYMADIQICRSDGRCQYAIDHGAEGLGHCPRGKCSMPDHGGPVA